MLCKMAAYSYDHAERAGSQREITFPGFLGKKHKETTNKPEVKMSLGSSPWSCGRALGKLFSFLCFSLHVSE